MKEDAGLRHAHNIGGGASSRASQVWIDELVLAVTIDLESMSDEPSLAGCLSLAELEQLPHLPPLCDDLWCSMVEWVVKP
jgi:hypothetical protein